VTNEQLYLAIGIPAVLNFGFIGMLAALLSARLDAMEKRSDARFGAVDHRLDAINQRFDDMRDLWRSELHRVEEVLDARLKHLEER